MEKQGKPIDTKLIAVVELFLKKVHYVVEKYKNANINQIRLRWTSWNVFQWKSDHLFSLQMQNFRTACRNTYLKERNISFENENLKLNEMIILSYVVIMLCSQSIMDEKCEQQYYHVIGGRHDALSFIQPLQKVSFITLLEYYKSLFKAYSGLHRIKAHSFLYFMVALHIMESNVVPTSHMRLCAFQQMNAKKNRVSMNAVGHYIGAGVDTHLERVIGIIANDFNTHTNSITNRRCGKRGGVRVVNNVSKKFISDLAGQLHSSVGMYANDDIGEISQQFQRGNKILGGGEWAKTVLNAISEENELFNKIVQQWVSALK